MAFPKLEEVKNISVVLGSFLLAGLTAFAPNIPTEMRTPVLFATLILSALLAGSYQGHRFSTNGLITSAQPLLSSASAVFGDIKNLSPEAMAIISTLQAGQSPTIDQLMAIQPDLAQLTKDAEAAAKVGFTKIETPTAPIQEVVK
jgi:hypothetical protein